MSFRVRAAQTKTRRGFGLDGPQRFISTEIKMPENSMPTGATIVTAAYVVHGSTVLSASTFAFAMRPVTTEPITTQAPTNAPTFSPRLAHFSFLVRSQTPSPAGNSTIKSETTMLVYGMTTSVTPNARVQNNSSSGMLPMASVFVAADSVMDSGTSAPA